MTNTKQELRFDSILFDIHANSMKHLHQKLADHISQLIGTPKQSILTHLTDAEKEENSAIGNGVAIPHMRLERLTKPMIIFAKLEKAIDEKSADGIPIDLACLVLSPDYEGNKHLQRLAMVSRAFKNDNFCQSLRATTSSMEVRQVMQTAKEGRLAA
ncbi:MAG: PTS sugar transporter subunit IIA [Pseudomonadota bacterium]